MLQLFEKKGILLVRGGIDFNTAPSLCKNGCILLKDLSEPIFDLQEVIINDISAVALLIAWSRCASKVGKHVSFINLPKSLIDMIKLNGLQDILL